MTLEDAQKVKEQAYKFDDKNLECIYYSEETEDMIVYFTNKYIVNYLHVDSKIYHELISSDDPNGYLLKLIVLKQFWYDVLYPQTERALQEYKKSFKLD